MQDDDGAAKAAVPPFFLATYGVKDVRKVFWDVESLGNVFEVGAWDPGAPRLDIWYRLDGYSAVSGGGGLQPDMNGRMDPNDGQSPLVRDEAVRRILECNPALEEWSVGPEHIVFHDLCTRDGQLSLAAFIGVSDAADVFDPSSPSRFPAAVRPRTDMAMDFDPTGRDFYRIGFNSSSYDLTMTSLFFYESACPDGALPAPGSDPEGLVMRAPYASTMRRYNDLLFREYDDYMPSYLYSRHSRHNPSGLVPESAGPPFQYMPYAIYRNDQRSGLHVDAMMLNEHNRHTSLKRLLGMLGLQILESDKLDAADNRLGDMDALCDMIAYNVSDIVGTGQLFETNAYSAQFELKMGLMRTYPQVVVDQRGLKLVRAAQQTAGIGAES